MERETRQWARESEIREAKLEGTEGVKSLLRRSPSTHPRWRRLGELTTSEAWNESVELPKRNANQRSWRRIAFEQRQRESKMYLVSLLSDQHKDGDLLEDAEGGVIELSDEISDKSTFGVGSAQPQTRLRKESPRQ